jgi:hypothetical protein
VNDRAQDRPQPERKGLVVYLPGTTALMAGVIAAIVLGFVAGRVAHAELQPDSYRPGTPVTVAARPLDAEDPARLPTPPAFPELRARPRATSRFSQPHVPHEEPYEAPPYRGREATKPTKPSEPKPKPVGGVTK